MPLPERARDTLFMVETPEGVELYLKTAGPVIRLLAFLIDFGIRLGIGIFISFGRSNRPYGGPSNDNLSTIPKWSEFWEQIIGNIFMKKRIGRQNPAHKSVTWPVSRISREEDPIKI